MVDQSAPPNILEVLDGIGFPASKIDIVQYAQDHDASEEVLDQIQAMPDEEYGSMAAINRKLSEIEDLPGHENLWSSEPSEDIHTPETDNEFKIRRIANRE